MLPKKERFTRKEFFDCYKSGTRVTGKLMRLITCKSPTPKGSVVVSKKVAKSAVVRNTLRRKIYNILEEANRTKSMIVVLFPNAKTATRAALKKELNTLL